MPRTLAWMRVAAMACAAVSSSAALEEVLPLGRVRVRVRV